MNPWYWVLIALATPIVIYFSYFLTQHFKHEELSQMKKIEELRKLVHEESKACDQFLHKLSHTITWRISIFYGSFAALLSTLIYGLTTKDKRTTCDIVQFFLIQFIIINACMYRLLNHYQWHYINGADKWGTQPTDTE